MEREEIIDFLRENLNIEVSMNTEYECESDYVTSTVTLRIGDDIISESYDSININ